MRCKECREKIPDSTTKYCPECGALIKNINYSFDNTTKYAPPVQQQTYTRPYDEMKTEKKKFFPQVKKRKNNVPVTIIITVAVFLLVFVINAFNEINIDYDYFENNENLVFETKDAVISEAYSYINCFTESENGYTYDKFNSYTVIDWDVAFSDEFITGDDDFCSLGYELASKSFDMFVNNSDFSSARDYSSAVVMLNELQTIDYDTFKDSYMIINRHFPSLDTDYLSSLFAYNDTYIVTGTADFFDYTTQSTYSEDIQLVMINNGGYYEVVYDSIFMDAFLHFVKAEEASTN